MLSSESVIVANLKKQFILPTSQHLFLDDLRDRLHKKNQALLALNRSHLAQIAIDALKLLSPKCLDLAVETTSPEEYQKRVLEWVRTLLHAPTKN
jgi:hypothetical protein